jgi:hypothetical protein
MNTLKLLNIVKSVILLENRIDDAKHVAQNMGVTPYFDQLVTISGKVNSNHKYLLWLVNNASTVINNLTKVYETLVYFDTHN